MYHFEGNRTLIIGNTKHQPLREAKELEAKEKLLWLIDHPSPEFEYYLDQYAAGLHLGLKPDEARNLAHRLTKETFYNIPHASGFISTP